MNTNYSNQPKIEELLDMLDNRDSPENASGGWTQFLLYTGLLSAEQLQLRKGDGIPCPMCGGVDRFRYDNKSGRGDWYCNKCGGADGRRGGGRGWHLVKRLAGDETAKDLLREFFGDNPSYHAPVAKPNPAQAVPLKDEAAIMQSNQTLWDRGVDVTDDRPPAYYLARGIPAAALKGLQNVRLVDRLGYFVKSKDPAEKKPVALGYYPAILAKVQNAEGKMVAVHRTWLSTTRKTKVSLPEGNSAKKLSKSLGATGAAIQLFDAIGSEVLGVSEGIETGCAARALGMMGMFDHCLEGTSARETRKIPVWATYSANLLETLEIPAEVLVTLKVLIIFGDNDDEIAPSDSNNGEEGSLVKAGPGRVSAYKLKQAVELKYPTLKVIIEIPQVLGSDWNDILQLVTA